MTGRIDTSAKVSAIAGETTLKTTSAELLAALLPELARERVIGEKLAAEFLSLSYAYIRELRDLGSGPAWVRLGERRIGYRVRVLIEWAEARQRRGGGTRSPKPSGQGEAA